MFEKFLRAFAITADAGNAPLDTAIVKADEDLVATVAALGGKTFRNGLYRMYRGDQIAAATVRMERAYPEYAGRMVVFGFDWLGRQFAIDYRRVKNGKPLILLLEPGLGKAVQIPLPIIAFHNEELPDYADDALAAKFYQQWKAQDPEDIPIEKCIAYKIPLFLGGKDVVENLELSDLDVYLELCGQLRNRTAK